MKKLVFPPSPSNVAKVLYPITLITAMLVLVSSCKKDPQLQSSISNQIITIPKQVLETFPFADSLSLKSFDSDKDVLNYKFVKKLVMVELSTNSMLSDMSWENAFISEYPMIVYGFDSKPKYYTFLVLDSDHKAIGYITAYARKKSSTIIREVGTGIPNYATMVTKAGSQKYFKIGRARIT